MTASTSEGIRARKNLDSLNPDLGESRAQLIQRCKKFASRMPTGMFFTHTTAALLLGAPLPIEVERDSMLHISAVAESRAPHARGIRGHALDLDVDRELSITGSLLHTNATRTWFDLANLLRIHDLVAVGDYLIHWRNPRTSVQDLRAFCAKQSGRRGVRKARMALPLLSNRSESRPESVLRVILELGGLPHPQINHEIVFTQTGSLVRTDFAFPDQKVLLEYQGDYHRIRKDQ
ncbi:MAG: hypothetical protein KF844_06225 [Cryobacterium sp.]|nr:hypothetical protein [Cryobacterium sp.]